LASIRQPYSGSPALSSTRPHEADSAHEATAFKAIIVLMTLLIAGASMAFAVHQWWQRHHMMAIGFISFAPRGRRAGRLVALWRRVYLEDPMVHLDESGEATVIRTAGLTRGHAG
jgi:hypothetical protein